MTAPLLLTTSTAFDVPDLVLPSASMPQAPRVIRRSEVVPDPVRWVLTEETVPESSPHDLWSERVRCLLLGWAARTDRNVKIGRNLAVRWDRRNPQFGVDPDVVVIEPPPPEGDRVRSLKLWNDGHVAPRLAVEIVSASHPTKDYVIVPPKYAACGIEELWVLDPFLEGPRAHGGPHRLQVWRRLDDASFAQVHAGEGPAWSELIQGFLHVVKEESDIGWTLHLSTDQAGTDQWLTPHEAERAAKEAERAVKEEALREAEAARKKAEVADQRAEAAERRLRELEAQLARGR
jgi:Uma2 family endonuclease